MEKQSRSTRRWSSHADPIWADQRNVIAGEVLAMCARTQKAIALALENSEGWVSKLTHGDPSVGLHLERVEAIASYCATDAGPLAAAPFAALNRVYAERFSDAELKAALLVALQRETKLEGRENDAQIGLLLASDDLTDAELAVVEDELAERFIRSMAAEAVAAGLLWERRRRRESR